MDVSAYHDELRAVADRLIEFDTTDGAEAPANEWLRGRLDDLGFDTYTWTADADRLVEHPSFPDDPAAIDTADRPSVAGVLEVGDPDAGRTLVLNGHVDVVPASGASGGSSGAERSDGVPADPDTWSGPPFEPTREGEGDEETLRGRGAVDMKSGLAACVVAARALGDAPGDLDGRVVVESVVGEEEGGIGAAAAALDNPYPFERDAAIVAEPTELTPVTATEGSLMTRLRLTGRSAHAASAWKGESVLGHFEHLRAAIEDLEHERHERVTHPLYEDYPTRWPIVVGTVDAGSWASTVPAELTAELRVGVAPGETVDEVEAELRTAVAEAAGEREWLREHPPELERFSVQFESARVDGGEPVVAAVQDAMRTRGLDGIEPRGATYGADSRHYVAAGIPTVLFGPGTVEQAHFPDETIPWTDVETATDVLAAAARTYLAG